MSHLVELEQRSKRTVVDELIFPCDCANGCYLRITWDDDDPDFRFLWVEAHRQRTSWRSWLRDVWRSFRGWDVQHTEVILAKESIVELRSWLDWKVAS